MHKLILFLFIIPLLLMLPTRAHVLAQQAVKPDIRNYAVLVDTREMPIRRCGPYTPDEWIKMYIGYNALSENNMKFSDRLFAVGDQFERASTRLTPYIVKNTMNKTMDEPGNKPSWVGSICCKGGWCGDWKQLVGDTIIEAEDPITTMVKQIRFGSNRLSAYIARDHLSLTNGVYNTQRDPIEPDPDLQSPCNIPPPGVVQAERTEKGTGKNQFWSLLGPVLKILCNVPIALGGCQCAETAMYIKTDSMIQYNTDALCRTTGCTQEQLNVVAAQSRALPQAQDSGGFINAQARPGLMAQVQEMVIQIFQSITGKVDAQKTQNNVNTQSAPSSYYTTKALEVGADFLNCKLFPYAKRAEMPECQTNWLANLIGNIKNQIQGTPVQMISEPAETTQPTSTPNP